MEKARELLESEFKAEFGEDWGNELRDFEHAFSDYYEATMNAIREALNVQMLQTWVEVSNNELPEKGDKCWVQLINGDIEMDLGDGNGFVNNATTNVISWMLIEKPNKMHQ